jgi:hypothetical protein
MVNQAPRTCLLRIPWNTVSPPPLSLHLSCQFLSPFICLHVHYKHRIPFWTSLTLEGDVEFPAPIHTLFPIYAVHIYWLKFIRVRVCIYVIWNSGCTYSWTIGLYMILIYAMKFLEADEIKVCYDRSALKTKGQEAEGFIGFLLTLYFLDQEFPKMYVWQCYNYISNMLPRLQPFKV